MDAKHSDNRGICGSRPPCLVFSAALVSESKILSKITHQKSACYNFIAPQQCSLRHLCFKVVMESKILQQRSRSPSSSEGQLQWGLRRYLVLISEVWTRLGTFFVKNHIRPCALAGSQIQRSRHQCWCRRFVLCL